MSAFSDDDPLSTPQVITADPDRRFWHDGLGHSGFHGVMNLKSGFDEAWEAAFGRGENKRMAHDLLSRHGDTRHVQRNLLLAASYVDGTDVEAVGDVARCLFSDSEVPDENGRRYCRNGLAARIACKSPVSLLGARAIDEFSPRRNFALTIEGHRLQPPGPLATLDWPEIAGRALHGFAERRGLRLRAWVPRRWRHDVLLAFSEPGRSSPNWNPDRRFQFQPGVKQQWTWVVLRDGGHEALVAGDDPDRAVDVASALASAIWNRPRRYEWARRPLTPELLVTLHQALINPEEHKFKLLEIVAEHPGLHNRPTLKLSNTGQERVERALADFWAADVGLAKDPGHVLRTKVGFEHKRRRYRIELHYPEDALVDEPVVGFGTSGVHPDVAQAFATLVRDQLGIVLNPRSPADAPRQGPWPEKPTPLLQRHWERLLAPTVTAPAPWEKSLLSDLVKRGVVATAPQSVFRCGSPAILRRVRGAPDGCTGTVVGTYGRVSADQPFVQEEGEPLQCDKCGTAWPRDWRNLPWRERWSVSVDPKAAWNLALDHLFQRAPKCDQSAEGVFQWFDDGDVAVVVAAEIAALDRRGPGRGAGKRAAWFGASISSLAAYGERGLSLAELLADGAGALDRIVGLGLMPVTPDTIFLSEPPPAMYGTGGPREGGRWEKGIVQRGELGGAYLHQRRIVKAEHAMPILTLAALQRATEDAARKPDDRGWHRAEDIAEIINDELRALGVDTKLLVNARRVNGWVQRLRDSIDEATVPHVTGRDIIEDGNKNGLRLGARFNLDGFDVRHEARAYSMNPPARLRSPDT